MDEITYRKIRNAITTAPKLNLTWKELNLNTQSPQITDPEKLKNLVLDFLEVSLIRNLVVSQCDFFLCKNLQKKNRVNNVTFHFDKIFLQF